MQQYIMQLELAKAEERGRIRTKIYNIDRLRIGEGIMILSYSRPVLAKLGVDFQKRLSAVQEKDDLKIVDHLLELLDGSRSLEDIVGTLLAQGFGLTATFRMLQQLDEQDLIKEGDADLNGLRDDEREYYRSQMNFLNQFRNDDRITANWPSANGHGSKEQFKLKQATVVVLGSGIAYAYLAHHLASAGVGHIIMIENDTDSSNRKTTSSSKSHPWNLDEASHPNPFVKITRLTRLEEIHSIGKDISPNLLVYSSDHFDDDLASSLNKYCLDNSLSFLAYRKRFFEIDIGPLVIPKETACYTCYRLRRMAVLSESEKMDLALSNPLDTQLNFPLGIDVLALEVVKFLTETREPVTQGRLWRLNISNGKMDIHPVLKLPRCPACGVHKFRPERKLWEE